MADHGKVEYAIAEGNDLPAHEATYNDFLRLAYVGTLHVINIAIALAIVGTTTHWLLAVMIIFFLNPAVAAHGLITGAKAPSLVMVAFSLLCLAFAASG